MAPATATAPVAQLAVTRPRGEYGRTQGLDAKSRASSKMCHRLASTKCVSASNLRKRGTTLVTSQRQRSSKRVILGHARARRACGIPRRERIEVKRGEARDLLPHSAHLEARGRADGDEPGGRHERRSKLGCTKARCSCSRRRNVALPDEIIGPLPTLRGTPSRPPGHVVPGRSPRSRPGQVHSGAPIPGERADVRSRLRRNLRKVNPEQVVENGVVRRADRVHVLHQERFLAG